MKKKNIIIITVLIVLVFLILSLRFLNARNSTDLWCVYTKINNGNWERHLNVRENQMIIKLKQDDILYVSLYENSTVLYFWDINLNEMNGLEMMKKKKDEKRHFFGPLFQSIKEGENFDRMVFTFKAVASGNENIVFYYTPAEESQVYNIDIEQFEIEIIK